MDRNGLFRSWKTSSTWRVRGRRLLGVVGPVIHPGSGVPFAFMAAASSSGFPAGGAGGEGASVAILHGRSGWSWATVGVKDPYSCPAVTFKGSRVVFITPTERLPSCPAFASAFLQGCKSVVSMK